MAYRVNFAGGTSGSWTAWTEVAPSRVQDITTIAGTTRQTLEGTYSVRIENISVSGGAGFSAYTMAFGGTVNSAGYYEGKELGIGTAYNIFSTTSHSVRPTLFKGGQGTATFQRTNSGGSGVREYKEADLTNVVYTWSSAAMCGYYDFTLPTTAPTSINVSRISRNVTVTWGDPSDLGDSAVTAYLIQYKVGSGAYTTAVGGSIASVNTSTNTITMVSDHGLSAGDVIYLANASYPTLHSSLGNPTPGGTTGYTPYFVRTTGLTATAFTISTTGAGGSAVDLTDSGFGTMKVYQSGGHIRVASTARSYTYQNLTAGQTYTFRVSALNAVGASVASVSSSVLVTAAGRRYDESLGWTNINNAMRYNGSAWTPITTVKRYDGTDWVDLTTSI